MECTGKRDQHISNTHGGKNIEEYNQSIVSEGRMAHTEFGVRPVMFIQSLGQKNKTKIYTHEHTQMSG